jgi:ribonuclease HI
MKSNTLNPQQLTVYTDGGSRGNPGPAAIGVTVFLGSEELTHLSQYIGESTNNEAEYQALIAALNLLLQKKLIPLNLTFFLDSELVVKQVSGIYKVKKPHLQTFVAEIIRLTAKLKQLGCKTINFQHIPRSQNKRADELVNIALDIQALSLR